MGKNEKVRIGGWRAKKVAPLSRLSNTNRTARNMHMNNTKCIQQVVHIYIYIYVSIVSLSISVSVSPGMSVSVTINNKGGHHEFEECGDIDGVSRKE